jgi:hypothetical protein
MGFLEPSSLFGGCDIPPNSITPKLAFFDWGGNFYEVKLLFAQYACYSESKKTNTEFIH